MKLKLFSPLLENWDTVEGKNGIIVEDITKQDITGCNGVTISWSLTKNQLPKFWML